jgi:P27 family predicted phage terminase small subunit
MPARHRGRKSVSEFEVPPLQLVAATRLKAPAGLSRAAQGVWRSTVNAFPSDYFKPSDAPLLKVWCVTSVAVDQAAAALEQDGPLVDGPHGRKVMNPAMRILSTSAATLCAVGMKLRITPSARMRIDSAATKAAASSTAKRPWG